MVTFDTFMGLYMYPFWVYVLLQIVTTFMVFAAGIWIGRESKGL